MIYRADEDGDVSLDEDGVASVLTNIRKKAIEYFQSASFELVPTATFESPGDSHSPFTSGEATGGLLARRSTTNSSKERGLNGATQLYAIQQQLQSPQSVAAWRT